MNFILIYVSPNGTTKITTEILKSTIEEEGHSVELIDIGCKKNRENPHIIFDKLKTADIVGVGSPAYHMDMLEPINTLCKKIASNAGDYHFKTFLYLNYGGITSGKAFINISKILESGDIPIIGAMKVVAPHLHHSDDFPSKEMKEFIQSFYYEMHERQFGEISSNRLKRIFSPKNRVNLLYPFINLVKKRRELEINIDQSNCKGCGKCANECPVGAISMNDCAEINFDICIHCYHCVMTCHLDAVKAPVDKLDGMIKVNKKIMGLENPQNKIYS